MKKILIFTFAATLVLSGCAQKTITPFTAAERNELSSVSIISATMEPNKYREPEIFNTPIGTTLSPVVTGDGVVPIVVGSKVDTATLPEMKAFKEKNGKYYAAVESNIPNFVEKLNLHFLAAVKLNPFFSSRISEKSNNRFSYNVTEYGFVRAQEIENNEIKFKFYLGVALDLHNVSGKRYLAFPIHGESTEFHTLEEFAADASLIAESVDQAIEGVIGELDYTLKFKTQEWEF